MNQSILYIQYLCKDPENVDYLELNFNQIKEFNVMDERYVTIRFKSPIKSLTLLDYFDIFFEGYKIPKNKILYRTIYQQPV